MDCIVLIRMPRGEITAIMDENAIFQFPHRDAAIKHMETHILRDYPYQIVELDEL